jgi:hypothetical protein
MLTQQRKIEERLGDYGWEVVHKETDTGEWWADEIWTLRSFWKPQGCVIRLAFLVDPQWSGPRKKGQGVWAVNASAEKPERMAETTLSLGRGWEKDLPEFLSRLADLRRHSLLEE